MIRDGFQECMRVLKPDGVLIFKWSEYDIPAKKVWAAIGQRPLFGHHSGKKSKTFWACFMKGGGVMAEIRPISFRAASNFVAAYHRHHRPPAGCKFCIGLYEGDVLIGVAMCGRPVSRRLDDGLTCEVNRLCTNGAPNACSQLYGAAARTAKAMGYRRIITYILASEDGASLRASNFVCEGPAGGTHWAGERNRGQDLPAELKTRWTRRLK